MGELSTQDLLPLYANAAGAPQSPEAWQAFGPEAAAKPAPAQHGWLEARPLWGQP
jgi:hypothetical protein